MEYYKICKTNRASFLHLSLFFFFFLIFNAKDLFLYRARYLVNTPVFLYNINFEISTNNKNRNKSEIILSKYNTRCVY